MRGLDAAERLRRQGEVPDVCMMEKVVEDEVEDVRGLRVEILDCARGGELWWGKVWEDVDVVEVDVWNF